MKSAPRTKSAPGARTPTPLELPFDQYQRYRLVTDVLERLRAASSAGDTAQGDGASGNRSPLELLDVGGRTALLREFLGEDRVTLVDVEPSDERDRLVLGDGSALPFADNSFDVVCAFDTLEHVPPGRRTAFVAECARVSRTWVILAGPYDSPDVRQAEALLTGFLDDKLAIDHRYLSEHAEHGLPDRAAVEQQFADLGAKVTAVGHANLERWCALMCVEMYLDDDPALREFASQAYAFYNERLYATDHAEPVYRHAVVAALGGAELPDLTGLFAGRDTERGPGGADRVTAPVGAAEAFGRLVRDLAAFDTERARWRKEREAFELRVSELAGDLTGHRARIASLEKLETQLRADLATSVESARTQASELEARLAEERSVSATLEENLAGHKLRIQALEALEQELRGGLERTVAEAAAQAAAFEQQLSDQRDVVRTLEADLAGHARVRAADEAEKASLKELVGALEKERDRERADFAGVRATLEEDLAGHRERREEDEQELARLRELAASLRAELEAERTEGAAAREALEADLAGHRDVQRADEQAKAELGALVDALRAELEQERNDSGAARAALEADLAGHKDVIAALRVEETALREEQAKLLSMIPKRKRGG